LRRNWFGLALSLLFVGIGTLPYLYGYALETDGMRFMGFVGRGVFGHNGYLMLARQAQEGLHLMENLLAPEPLPRVFFNIEWWLYGKAARWTGLSLVAVFHFYRAASVFLFAFSVVYLLRRCLETVFQRRFALAWVMLGSGFGWMLVVGSRALLWLMPSLAPLARGESPGVLYENVLIALPPDVGGVSIPPYLVNQPHFPLAVGLVALTYGLLIAGAQTGRMRYYVYCGLAALAHTAVRPYNIPEMYLIFLLYPALLCAREGRLDVRRFAGPAVAGAIMLPMVLYCVYLAYTGALGGKGPVWQPGLFVDHILWLGLPFILAVVSFRGLSRLKEADPAILLVGLWLVVAFLVEQSWPYYRSGQEGSFAAYMVAPVILATAGPLRWAYEYLVRRRPGFSRARLAVASILILSSMPSAVLVYYRMFADLREHPAPYYISNDIYGGMKWLEANAGRHDTVLAGFDTGQLVPRLAGVKTFQGHYMITPNAGEKRAMAERFYGTRGDDAFKRKLVRDYGIRYVFLSPLERRPSGIEPAEHPWLAPVFSQGGTGLYRVQRGTEPTSR
jgi:hypothetical protein